MCQMNSALAKLQYLSNQSEFVFAGDNGNPPYQDSNRLRFCNLVAPKPKSVHNLPFWPTEAYQAHRSPLAYCHWAACTIMPIGQEGHCAKNISWHILGEERQRLLILEPLYSTSSHTTPLSFAAHPVSSHFNSHTPSFSEEPSQPSSFLQNSELLQSKQRKTNSVTTKIR